MRALPFLLDVAFLALFVAFMATQIIIPLWKERPMFPMFNRERRQATDALSDALEKSDVLDIKRRAKRVAESNRRNRT